MAPHALQHESYTGTALEQSPAVADAEPPSPPPFSSAPPRLLVIGAGSRGHTYAKCSLQSSNGVVVAVAEPDDFRRRDFGEKYIWSKTPPEGSSFTGWTEFVAWEKDRRERQKAGESVPEGIDAAFICVRDDMHHDVIMALAPLGLHILCEKPLATTLEDCTNIYHTLAQLQTTKVFSIGHVLRYSPHNITLRELLLEDNAIGDILSINHTEPVGYWHFAHSYVRGNWRRESTTAPSLLTKSCHDIDILLWLMCSAPSGSDGPPHLPTSVSSTGSLQFFRKSRKPRAAGNATNCFSCPAEIDCIYSSKKIYIGPEHMGLETGNTSWPISVVIPDIESFGGDIEQAKAALLPKLAEDYDGSTPQEVIDSKNWFGRCVFESDNDVCDEQVVTIAWDDDPLPSSSTTSKDSVGARGAKQAMFHMIAQTKKQCERFTHVYGTEGEIYADSKTITVEDFRTGKTKTYRPKLESLGHGGGDHGLTRQFVLAVDKVKNGGWKAQQAQREFIGCSLEEIIRSHAMVFAAEEARKNGKTVNWKAWWDKNVSTIL
ncbi:NAD(P)-binding protein [Xylariaceae sp. FL1651]|nr:NAD(P)-binding protein [Xylariaceae sp. FL1651]